DGDGLLVEVQLLDLAALDAVLGRQHADQARHRDDRAETPHGPLPSSGRSLPPREVPRAQFSRYFGAEISLSVNPAAEGRFRFVVLLLGYNGSVAWEKQA